MNKQSLKKQKQQHTQLEKEGKFIVISSETKFQI